MMMYSLHNMFFVPIHYKSFLIYFICPIFLFFIYDLSRSLNSVNQFPPLHGVNFFFTKSETSYATGLTDYAAGELKCFLLKNKKVKYKLETT